MSYELIDEFLGGEDLHQVSPPQPSAQIAVWVCSVSSRVGGMIRAQAQKSPLTFSVPRCTFATGQIPIQKSPQEQIPI